VEISGRLWREVEEPEKNKVEWMFLVCRGRIEVERTPLMHRERTMMLEKM
jgi:hypothetical protein